MRLERVLVAAGTGTPAADDLAAAALEVAGPAEATVAVAHVFPEESYAEFREKLDFDHEREVTPDAVAGRQVAVRRIRETLTDAGLAVTTHGSVGDRGAELVALAERLDADRVLIGGRRRSPAGKALFGSAAQTVLLNAPCPVTFVPDD